MFKELDPAVLTRDLPGHRLRAGDVGTVVHSYADGEMGVEFVLGSGVPHALVTLIPNDLRPIADSELLAVRAP